MTAAPPFDQLLSRAIIGLGEPRAADDIAGASLRRLAGRQAIGLAPAPGDGEDDPRPAISARANIDLQLLLERKWMHLAQHWLDAVDRAGKRTPYRMLPVLLDLGATTPSLLPRISTACGVRGAWLAAQNPKWRVAPDLADPTVWETGTIEERAAWLRRYRRREPDVARSALAAIIDREKSQHRSKLLAALKVGLSPTDEAFLEARLSDGSSEVRGKAASLLSRLPQSALVQRMTARASQYVVPGPNRSVEIILPTPGPELMRDGIDVKELTRFALVHEEKRGLLSLLVSFVPPSEWAARFGMTPEAFVDACCAHDDGLHVINGLAEAAIRHQGKAWVRAILFRGSAALFTRGGWRLLSVFPEAERAHVLVELARAKPEAFADRKQRLLHAPAYYLTAFDDPWVGDTAVELTSVAIRMATESMLDHDQLEKVVTLIPRALLGPAIESVKAEAKVGIAQFLEFLAFRRDMLDAIDEDG